MSSSSGLRGLESKLGCVLSEQLDLLVAVSLLVVLGPFVNVSLTVLQHAMDESGRGAGPFSSAPVCGLLCNRCSPIGSWSLQYLAAEFQAELCFLGS
jgi:hypothetical protein